MGKLKTTEDFIKEVQHKWLGKYTYELTEYKNAHKKIWITCVDHGPFEITPDSHRRGSGCAKCKAIKVGNHNRGSMEATMKILLAKHGTKYDYSLFTEYSNCKARIDIGCPIHGVFNMVLNDHKSGQGCPKCKTSGYNTNKSGHLYILVSECGITKLGITNRTVKKRLSELNKDSGKFFTECCSYFFEDGKYPINIETQVLKYLKSKYKSLDKQFCGSSDCFEGVDLIDLISKISPLAVL